MPDEFIHVLLIEDNPGDARLVKELLAEVEGTPFRVQWAETLLEGLDWLTRAEFNIALVDLSLPDSNGLETFDTVRRHAPAIPIVLLTGNESDSIALHAVEKGAQDYLVKGKFSGDSLGRVLRYAVVRSTKQAAAIPAPAAPAKITGILGAKGGVGTTTLACHAAVELARQCQTPVLLADLDVSSAAGSFLLKANARHSILDTSTNLHRLDADLWKGMVWSAASNLDLIQAPGAVRLGDQLSGERIRHVLRFARRLYRHIVVDLGRLNAVTASVLGEMQQVLLVATPDVQSLFEAKRVFQQVGEIHRASVRLIVNRMQKRLPISRSEIEKGLGFTVYAELPDCPQELSDAYTDGRLLGESTALRRHIAALVARLEGTPEVTTPASLRVRLFGVARA